MKKGTEFCTILDDKNDFGEVFNTIDEIIESSAAIFSATIITLTASDLTEYEYKLVKSERKKGTKK